MNDLYLSYQFTDRAGRRVYNIYCAPDTGQPVFDGLILGQMRINPDKDDNVLLEWVEETKDED